MGSRKPPGEHVATARPSGRDLSRDTAPGGPPLSDPGPDPEPAPPRDDGYRYERPTLDDSLAMRLLGGLNAERFPRTTTVDQSSGQLAAHYHAGPRTLPMGSGARPEEPSVLLSCTSIDEMPPPGAEQPGYTLRMRRVHEPVELPITVAIPRRARLPAWLIAVCGLVILSCLGILGLALARARSGVAASEPAATATGSVVVAGSDLPGEPELPPVSPVPSASSSAALSLSSLALDSASAAASPPPAPPRPAALPRPRPRVAATRPSPHESDVPVSTKLDREE